MAICASVTRAAKIIPVSACSLGVLKIVPDEDRVHDVWMMKPTFRELIYNRQAFSDQLLRGKINAEPNSRTRTVRVDSIFNPLSQPLGHVDDELVFALWWREIFPARISI